MPATTPCVPASCCTTSQTTDIPGSAGENAFTLLTANLTIPVVGGSVAISVASNNWIGVGQTVFITDGTDFGHFAVTSLVSTTGIVANFTGQEGDAAPAAVIGSGGLVAPGGTQQDFDAAALQALNAILLSGIGTFTDNTTGTASDTLAAGVGVSTLALFVNLSAITATTIFSFTPGFAFKVLAIQFSSEIAVTTGAKAATLTPAIAGSGVTGGALALTSANCTPKGTTVSGSSITANNTGTAAQTLSLAASSVTAFSEGTGWVLLRIQNMDQANSIASLADKVNDILNALQ